MNDDYVLLEEVLKQALLRASEGKGKDRHAEDKPFSEQDIVAEGRFLRTAPHVYQVRKKAKETLKLTGEAEVNEWLDVIVYAAAAVIVLRENCQ